MVSRHSAFNRLASSVFIPLLVFFAVLSLHNCVEAQVLSQWSIGEKGCGPCAVINSLIGTRDAELLEALEGRRAVDKARSFIREYGDAESVKYREHRKCFSRDHGTADLDLQHMINTFLRENEGVPVQGMHVQRADWERTHRYIRRIHAILDGSISAKFHPIVSVRALAAEKADEPDENGDEKFVWNGKGAHWITVNSVGKISQDGLGFVMNFSDSISGRKLSGYIHVERHRAAVVPMTFTVNDEGKEEWDWVSSKQCLMINAPGMPLGTVQAKWQQRTFTVLRYLIYRDPEAKPADRDAIEVTRSAQSSQG